MLSATPASAPAPVSARFSRTVCFAPCPLTIHLTVERHADNRGVTLLWVSEDGEEGSHFIQLDGKQAARFTDFPLTLHEVGEYTFGAILTRTDGDHLFRLGTLLVQQ